MASRWRFKIEPIEKWDTDRLIYCPKCRGGQQAKWLVIRKWLKLGESRVFPMWAIQRFLVCQQCGERYDAEILRFHPGRRVPPLDRQMLRVMIYAALADGLVDTAERKTIGQLYVDRFDMVLLEDQLQMEIDAAQQEASSLNTYVAQDAEVMTPEQKHLVVELSYRVMTAGGTPKPGHERQLHNLATSLQIPPSEVDAVVTELQAMTRETPSS